MATKLDSARTAKVAAAVALLAAGLMASPGALGAQAGTKYASWAELEADLVETTILRQWIPMRDGIRLDAEIYLPNTASPPYPTVLIRSPYPASKTLTPTAIYTTFVENGYAIVYQNERGRYWSEGEHEYLARAGEDGYDTVDWIAKQDWSNGRVGTIGCSSSAENQLRLISAAHPAHAAAIAQAPGAGIGEIGPYAEQGNTFRGGALQLLFASWYHDYMFYGGAGDARPRFPADLSREDRVRLSRYFELGPTYGWGKPRPGFDYQTYYRHLPVSELNRAIDGPRTDWDRFARRTPGDPSWDEIHLANEGDTFGVPALWVFSWYDIAVAPNVALYNYARKHTSTERARGSQHMIIGPMPHCSFGTETERSIVGERNLGDARFDYVQRYLEWFDHWVKGESNGAPGRPAARWYQMGANEWLTGDVFPPRNAEAVDLFLDSGGSANTLYGDGVLRYDPAEREGSDGYVYDPLRPVQTHGGGACCMGDVKATGAYDQSTLEMRGDVLVYTTPPLEEDLTVAGFVEVELYVSSDARDTDFTVKLVDVYPDGTAYNLDDSIFRARYREGYDRQVFLEPGEVVKITFPPLITANTFAAGHAVRVEISSSNFPRYGRNLNTGGANYDESDPVVARNRVHHSGRHPSKIRLPVSR
ncbi:MAG: CocE/NonD family hydrolase [Thermoanaerobaculia bacterium]|nr:CocE/NonD family hydrolase [Thermoanaerobaculia bacterium]